MVKRLRTLDQELRHLRHPDTRKEMDPTLRRQAERAIVRRMARIREIVCSGVWADELTHHDEHATYPIPGMMLSRAKTSWGDTGRKCRRWTPPQCVNEEDRLDEMSIDDAEEITGQASSCGCVIFFQDMK